MHSFIPQFEADGAPSDPTRGPAPAHSLTIKKWTREILRLDDDAVVTVSELACADPGCPLIETVIAVFDQHGSRKWKLIRAKAAITKLNVYFALTAPSTASPSTTQAPPALPPRPSPPR
jgi:hypothetical protein